MAALRLGLSVLLRLFAPVLPYITEEVWSWSFADETGHAHIHGAPWPGQADFEGIDAPARADSFEVAVAALQAINKAKADGAVSMGREVEALTLAAGGDVVATLEGVLADVLAAGRVQSHVLVVDDTVEAGTIEARNARFAPKPEKS